MNIILCTQRIIILLAIFSLYINNDATFLYFGLFYDNFLCLLNNLRKGTYLFIAQMLSLHTCR